MSTILDALRKVEEEKRTQEADVRTRLLSTSSARFDFRMRRRSQMPWVVGGGLVLVGTLLGAGIMMWSASGPSADEVAVAPAPTTANALQVVSVSTQQPVTPTQPLPNPAPTQPQGATMSGQVPDSTRHNAETIKPPPQVQITPNAPGVVLPKEPQANVPVPTVPQPSIVGGGLPTIAETSSDYNPWHGGNPQSTIMDNSIGRRGGTSSPSAEVVQRSPFVSSSPYDRIVASPTPLPPSAPRVTAMTKAPVQRLPAPEEKRSKAPFAPVPTNDTAQNAPRSRPASSPATAQEVPDGAPPGASLSFLQWSADPEKRVASIKVGTGPATIAHEGDSIEGMTIEKIRPDAVELRSGTSRYLLKAR